MIEIGLPASPSAEARERFEQREQTAALEHFVKPSTVAVVGASRRGATVGGDIRHNIVSRGFAGAIALGATLARLTGAKLLPRKCL